MARQATSAVDQSEGDSPDVLSTLVCAECGRLSAGSERGWQGHLVDGDGGGADEVLFFCPRCAEREFGRPHRDAGDGSSKAF